MKSSDLIIYELTKEKNMKLKMKTLISNAWIYILFVVIMIMVISMKKDYHMDEVFSYGLANNVGHTSIHPDYAPYTYHNPAQVFLDYMVIEEDEGFNVSNCWYNQERESSPPLYYFMVHIMSVFAGQRFSRWTAGVINLCYLCLTLWAFRDILKFFGVKGKKLDLFSLYFVFSPAILSDASFFRMYTMAIFFATWITALLLKYRGREDWKFFFKMVIVSICAVLTQYYLIFYLFFSSLIYGISLLWEKEWEKAGKYILSMGVAGGLTYLIFPGIIEHLFSASRGAEGIENFQKGFSAHWYNLKEYCQIINEQLFGNLFWIILIVSVVALLYICIKRKERLEKSIDVWNLLIAFFPAVGYILIVAKVAPYNTDRYIMAVFAVIIVAILLGLDWIFEGCFAKRKIVKKCCLGCACLLVLASIWKDFHWPYLYLSEEKHINKIAEYSDVDGLCVLDVGWKISGNFNEMSKLGSLTFFQTEISALDSMPEMKNKEEYILYVVDCDAAEIMHQIYAICPQINSYEYLGDSDFAEIYYLYHED